MKSHVNIEYNLNALIIQGHFTHVDSQPAKWLTSNKDEHSGDITLMYIVANLTYNWIYRWQSSIDRISELSSDPKASDGLTSVLDSWNIAIVLCY